MSAFFHRDGDRYLPTAHTRGPWSAEHQHGGPPSALLAGAIEAACASHALARLSVQLLRPVPIAPLTVHVAEPVGGRTAQRVRAELRHDGRAVVTAEGLLLRRAEVPGAAVPTTPLGPLPSSATPLVFPFFAWDEGYHQAIELHPLPGEAWGGPSLRLWARSRFPIVAGQPITPVQSVVVLADAQSGFAPPAPVERFTFLNPELQVALARWPRSTWIGLDVRSWCGDQGVAIARSTLHDEVGAIGQSEQVMVLAAR